MKRLVIDIGNTRCKLALFVDGALRSVEHSDQPAPEQLAETLARFGPVDEAILSAVRAIPAGYRDLLRERCPFVAELTHATPVPITNLYQTPHTLGLDRLAAAVGAASLFPGRNLLVIDAGTAITIDRVSAQNQFLGGNISPGIETRFRALNHFTGKLPLVDLRENFEPLGTDTQSAIRAGVQQGVIFELESYIRHYSSIHPDLLTIIAGGHASILKKFLPEQVILSEHLTLIGLHRILEFNPKQAGEQAK